MSLPIWGLFISIHGVFARLPLFLLPRRLAVPAVVRPLEGLALAPPATGDVAQTLRLDLKGVAADFLLSHIVYMSKPSTEHEPEYADPSGTDHGAECEAQD